MWDLFVTVLPLALAAAVTPTLFALQVLVVAGPSWQTRARAVALGSGVVFAVVFALILGGLSQLPDAGTGKSTSGEYLIELVCGVLLIPAAIWLLMPHRRADEAMERKVEHYANHASPKVFAGLGAYMTITDFSSLVLVVPALHDVTHSSVAVVGKALVVVFIFACVMLPVLVPPMVVRMAGDGGVRALRRVYRWVMDHQIQIMGAIAVPLSIILIVRGVRGLQ